MIFKLSLVFDFSFLKIVSTVAIRTAILIVSFVVVAILKIHSAFSDHLIVAPLALVQIFFIKIHDSVAVTHFIQP